MEKVGDLLGEGESRRDREKEREKKFFFFSLVGGVIPGILMRKFILFFY